jgi:hypothetical protein
LVTLVDIFACVYNRKTHLRLEKASKTAPLSLTAMLVSGVAAWVCLFCEVAHAGCASSMNEAKKQEITDLAKAILGTFTTQYALGYKTALVQKVVVFLFVCLVVC